MASIVEVVIGAALIVGTILTWGALSPALAAFLISAGASLALSGVGSLLSKQQGGLTTASRNPIAPWTAVYGRAKVGGTIVYLEETGDDNKYLHLVLVLACHPCEAVDALYFNNQRVLLDGNNNSFSPHQQRIGIASIVRNFDVVSATLTAPLPVGADGQTVRIEGVSDRTMNGQYAITQTGPSSFTYICGGYPGSASGGSLKTAFPDYQDKVHMEVLLGNHAATFPGLLYYSGGQWSEQHRLLGHTAVYLKLHYNDAVFANGLPSISFLVRGKNDVYDPRKGLLPSGAFLQRPTVLLNGWGQNAQAGPYELGVDQATRWGRNNDTTYPYDSPTLALDDDEATCAQVAFRHTHKYAGCLWSFAAQPTSLLLYLNVLSEVPANTGRSAGIWYSLDGGSNYTMLYEASARGRQWDRVVLPNGQDLSQVRVMAFTDAHDDMVHKVYDLQIASGTNSSRGYSENAALCIADYLAHPTWGFKATYGTEIPIAPLIAAANICEESVPLLAGGTEHRYTCNGIFPLTTKRGEVLQNLLTACAGRLTYAGGQFVIHPAAWTGVPRQILADQPPRLVPPGTRTARVSLTSIQVDGTYNDGYADDIVLTINSGENLVVNGSAEQGLTGWVVTEGYMDALAYSSYIDPHLDPDTGGTYSGNFPDPPTPASGAYFFGGGSEQPRSTIRQTIDLSSLAANIDAGGAPFQFSAYLGGWLNQRDNMSASVEWLNASGTVLDSLTLGPVTVADRATRTTLVYRSSGEAALLGNATGPFQWRSKRSIRDLYNGVKGTYISPSNNWQSSDIPPYAQDAKHGYVNGPAQYNNDANLALDRGERRWLEIQLPFTISASTAQRLAKIELLRRRQQGSGTFAFNLAMYAVTALDVLQLTFPPLGWQGKLLEVSAHRFTQVKQSGDSGDAILLGTELDLEETDPSVYAWSPSEELTPQGYQQAALPTSANTMPPMNFALLTGSATTVTGADGLSRSRLLATWNAPADGYVLNGGSIEARYRKPDEATWTALQKLDPSITQLYIDGVADGQAYIVQIRSVNAAGVPSAWIEAGPATVSGTASQLQFGTLVGAPGFTVNGR